MLHSRNFFELPDVNPEQHNIMEAGKLNIGKLLMTWNSTNKSNVNFKRIFEPY